MTFTSIDQSLLGPYSSSASTFLGVGRNRFINGEMSIDQQNGGNVVTVNNSGIRFWSVDGNWFGSGQPASGVFTLQRLSATPPTGFTNYLRIQTTTADATIASQFYILRTLWEGLQTRDFLWGTANAKTITVSFWVRGSITGTYSFALTNATATRFYVATYVINSANTWEKKIVTIPGDTVGTWVTDTTQNLVFTIPVGVAAFRQTGTTNQWVTSGTELDQATGAVNIIQTLNATLDFTGMQMEIGSAATPYEYKPFALELQLCQRLFEKSYDIDTAVGTATGTNGDEVAGGQTGATTVTTSAIYYKVTKRVNPIVTTWDYSGTSGNGAWRSTSGVDTNRATTVVNGCTRYFGLRQTVALDYLVQCQWAADARL